MQGKIKSFERKKSAKNSEYLRIELEDGYIVHFWDTKDSSKNVKEGDSISFEVKVKGDWNNGSKLEVLSSGTPIKTVQIPEIENKPEIENIILKAINANTATLEKIVTILNKVFK